MEKEKQDIPNSAVTCIYWENPVLLERPEYGSGADVDIARKIAHCLCHGILQSNLCNWKPTAFSLTMLFLWEVKYYSLGGEF